METRRSVKQDEPDEQGQQSPAGQDGKHHHQTHERHDGHHLEKIEKVSSSQFAPAPERGGFGTHLVLAIQMVGVNTGLHIRPTLGVLAVDFAQVLEVIIEPWMFGLAMGAAGRSRSLRSNSNSFLVDTKKPAEDRSRAGIKKFNVILHIFN